MVSLMGVTRTCSADGSSKILLTGSNHAGDVCGGGAVSAEYVGEVIGRLGDWERPYLCGYGRF